MRYMRKIANKIYLRIEHALAGTRAADRKREKLKRLYPGEPPDKLMEDYYTGLLAALLGIGAAGIISAAALLLFWPAAGKSVTWLQRNPLGGGSRYVELSIKRQDGRGQSVRLEVKERIYAEETLRELYLEANEILGRRIQGENTSLMEITGPMELPDEISGYPFQIVWQSSRPEIIGADGVPQQGIYGREEEAELTAVFRCQGFEERSTWRIRVCFPEATDQEKWEEAMWKKLRESDEGNACQEKWELPGEIVGERITWEEKTVHPAWKVLGLTGCCMLLTVWSRSRETEKRRKEREAALEEEYCNVVTKLALYLGAGMTVTGAWRRTAVSGGTGENRRYVYEEMRLACRELDSGISESRSFEAFGRRCGRQEYARLSTLLSQNLKKGNRELLRRMREEALQAQENQKNVARRRGEEAAAKLLLPMVMMLGMVLTMIILPAFGTVG